MHDAMPLGSWDDKGFLITLKVDIISFTVTDVRFIPVKNNVGPEVRK
jgi:hypothetical protein